MTLRQLDLNFVYRPGDSCMCNHHRLLVYLTSRELTNVVYETYSGPIFLGRSTSV